MKQNIQAGSATRELAPGKPQMLQGYGARNKVSEGIADTPQTGCVAMKSEDTTVLILTFDMIGMHRSDADRITKAVEKETGIPQQNIMISCSHSHFVPGVSTTIFSDLRFGVTDPDQDFVTLVTNMAVEAAAEAVSCMAESELSIYRCRVPQVPFNRRTLNKEGMVETNFLYPLEPENLTFSPVDDELTVLRFEYESGARVYLLNFGCHPVTGGSGKDREFYKISADYIRWVRETIFQREGAEAFFMLGAAGDVVPMNRAGFSRQNIGSTIAGSALLGERAYRAPASPVGVKTKTVELEAVTSLGPPEMDNPAFEKLRGELIADENLDQFEFQEEVHRRFQLRLYPEGKFSIPIQFLHIGETVLVALPFEVFSELSLTMRKKYPNAVLVSCANGYQGYLPFEHDIAKGGYEAENRSMHFKPGTCERILAEIMKHLESSAG
jgi:hypothetical protein